MNRGIMVGDSMKPSMGVLNIVWGRKWKTQAELGKALGKTQTWVSNQISGAYIRKKEEIPAEISTSTISGTSALESEDRKQIIEKVRTKEIPERAAQD